MIIEFTIKNYRSIKEEMSLSMVKKPWQNRFRH